MAARQMMQSGGVQGGLIFSPRAGSGAPAGPLPGACDDAAGTAGAREDVAAAVAGAQEAVAVAGRLVGACVDGAATCTVWAAGTAADGSAPRCAEWTPTGSKVVWREGTAVSVSALSCCAEGCGGEWPGRLLLMPAMELPRTRTKAGA